MLAVIFEVTPKSTTKEAYLALATELKTTLVEMPGFISIERFQSLADPKRLLSLSFWEDEAAVRAWREQLCHRHAQTQGREHIFADYRLRVAEVVRDYGMFDRVQAPQSLPASCPDSIC
ncbi:antibiotic biosynthesis monooxygenase [Shewanella sp. AS16]|uniref:antibiotic biosynthesis monooxygenase family protein n=1 Tax=Shewanella sp. AS16 TaxID=2907625 RepID=UPI001F1C5B20|nr:antibiotic biosynthesis monooxygenase [Shewanella sp. AS16]MCE9684882.1 antibiotic biosynthesis monooxygenase [Shewanella sp. AS16]